MGEDYAKTTIPKDRNWTSLDEFPQSYEAFELVFDVRVVQKPKQNWRVEWPVLTDQPFLGEH